MLLLLLPFLLLASSSASSAAVVGSPLVIAWHTPSHAGAAARLRSSCASARLECAVTAVAAAEVARAGSYQAFKVRFARSQLLARRRAVVYVDADIEARSWPALLANATAGGGADYAFFDWRGGTLTMPPVVATGVFFLNYTVCGRRLAAAWEAAMAFGTNRRAADDQVVSLLLQAARGDGAIARRLGGCRCEWLPPEYLAITGHPAFVQSYTLGRIVFEHTGMPSGAPVESPLLPDDTSLAAALAELDGPAASAGRPDRSQELR